jgi:peroxiredoxin
MKKRRGTTTVLVTVLLLVVGATALSWMLERRGIMPIVLRDRPWSLALGAITLSMAAAAFARRRVTSRSWFAVTCVVAILASASAALSAWTIRARYALPSSSPSAGVGAPLPELSFADDSGAVVALSHLRGRPTLFIWFRGTWCPYCRKQLADLAPIARQYADRVQVVAVTSDSSELLSGLRRELSLPFPLLSDPDGQLMRQCELSHCVAILDSDGIVRWGVLSGNWDKLSPVALLQSAAERR